MPQTASLSARIRIELRDLSDGQRSMKYFSRAAFVKTLELDAFCAIKRNLGLLIIIERMRKLS